MRFTRPNLCTTGGVRSCYSEVVWEVMWTDESEDHIARHHVTPAEVEEVVNSRPVYYDHGREETTLVYGRTNAGRPLVVVLSEALDGRWYVATARRMTDSEFRTYRRKAR